MGCAGKMVLGYFFAVPFKWEFSTESSAFGAVSRRQSAFTNVRRPAIPAFDSPWPRLALTPPHARPSLVDL
eukprot:5455982-Prymnesium_polylepis.2